MPRADSGGVTGAGPRQKASVRSMLPAVPAVQGESRNASLGCPPCKASAPGNARLRQRWRKLLLTPINPIGSDPLASLSYAHAAEVVQENGFHACFLHYIKAF